MTDTWNTYANMANDELERAARGGDNLLARELAKRMGAAEDEIRELSDRLDNMEDEDDVT
jgi:hypothetical protein